MVSGKVTYRSIGGAGSVSLALSIDRCSAKNVSGGGVASIIATRQSRQRYSPAVFHVATAGQLAQSKGDGPGEETNDKAGEAD